MLEHRGHCGQTGVGQRDVNAAMILRISMPRKQRRLLKPVDTPHRACRTFPRKKD
ncbi:hypothetical protein [Sphingomonas sp. 22R3R2A-7]|uniref:hypothetical protein n=1 Tax=Sphingomonas sp. 22R3R2A-7 TaxID=3050230 RepID=UPI002FE25AE7